MQKKVRDKKPTMTEIKNCNDEGFIEIIDKELIRLFPQRIIKRVLLIVPPDADSSLFSYETCKRGRYWNYPPYGLGIIAKLLLEDGLQVKVLNLNNQILKRCKASLKKEFFKYDEVWQEYLSATIESFSPDFISVTAMFTQTHRSLVQVCTNIKAHYKTIPLAVGGVHITNCFMNRDQLKKEFDDLSVADLLFLFEAEQAYRLFVQSVNSKKNNYEIYQVYFISKQLYFTEKRIISQNDLNVIPSYDLLDIEDLSDNGVIGSFFCLKEKKVRCATVLSNRGCRGKCSYCSVRNFNGSGVRARSIQSVIDELLLLQNEFGVEHIMWLDDDFLYGHKRAIKLFNEMIRQHVKMTWDCTNGIIASSCKEEIIDAAEKSGCIGVNIGVESGNPDILKKIKKTGSIKNFLKAAEIMKKFETINSRVFLMIGFPKETYRMILDTYKLSLLMDLDWYNITIFQPLPNTSIFKTMINQGLVDDNIDTKEVRFNSGAYGKKSEKNEKKIFSSEMRNPFDLSNLDCIPPQSELENIWLYLNYFLNFNRLLKVKSSIKLNQHFKYLSYITNIVAPEDPFPMYFCCYLQKQVQGKIDPRLINRLETALNNSEYWRNSFGFFDLSLDYLKNGFFPTNSDTHKVFEHNEDAF